MLNRCMLFRVRITRRQSIKTKKNMKVVIFQHMLVNVPPLITLIFCPNLLFKLFLRDFSEVVVLKHSKLMRLFNNIPSTNASKGQWPHPIVYRSERNLEIKIASSY